MTWILENHLHLLLSVHHSFLDSDETPRPTVWCYLPSLLLCPVLVVALSESFIHMDLRDRVKFLGDSLFSALCLVILWFLPSTEICEFPWHEYMCEAGNVETHTAVLTSVSRHVNASPDLSILCSPSEPSQDTIHMTDFQRHLPVHPQTHLFPWRLLQLPHNTQWPISQGACCNPHQW